MVELVSERALTGYQIARALEDRYHVVLRGREGALYAALTGFVRKGFLCRNSEITEDGAPRHAYALPVLVDIGGAVR